MTTRLSTTLIFVLNSALLQRYLPDAALSEGTSSVPFNLVSYACKNAFVFYRFFKTHSRIVRKKWMGLETRLLIILLSLVDRHIFVLNSYRELCIQAFTQWFAICTQYKWSKAKEWCRVYNTLPAGDVSIKLRGFDTSLQNDLAAVANISDRIDRTSLAMFMNIIDECSGQIFTSGIGRL